MSRQLVYFCDLYEQYQPLFFSNWSLWNMAVSILIWYVWYKWIQACWINQVVGKGTWCVFVHSWKFTYTHLSELDIVNDHIECVFAKMHLNDQTYITGVVYRPPNSNVDFTNTMHSILEKVTQYPYYIMGGCNLDLLKHDKHPPLTNFLILCMLTLLYRWSIVPQGWPTSILITIA